MVRKSCLFSVVQFIRAKGEDVNRITESESLQSRVTNASTETWLSSTRDLLEYLKLHRTLRESELEQLPCTIEVPWITVWLSGTNIVQQFIYFFLWMMTQITIHDTTLFNEFAVLMSIDRTSYCKYYGLNIARVWISPSLPSIPRSKAWVPVAVVQRTC
jgi:hypothetical protein